ncbi:MAG: cation:proton antiporter [Actinobacteria bacterium]|nr:cation:proton antiporter [Actinomycetota bacterium]
MFPTDLLLIDIAIILAAARLFGAISSRLGQPVVIGEILAGIALGPTLLGQVAAGHNLFPPAIVPALTTVADIGLVLYMFLVGMELDRELVHGKLRVAAGVATGATALPLALGLGVAIWLAPRYASGGKLVFVLFFAVSVSATAFPVLARILTDKGLERTLLGGLSLAAAAVIDVVSYALLAVVVAIASAAGHESWRLLFVPVYFLTMLFVVRPFLKRLVAPAFDRAGRVTPRLCGVLIGLFFSAWVCQWMQVNFIFGAFVFGAVMPRSDGIVRYVRNSLESAVHLMLPVFFVITGLTVNLTTLRLDALAVLAAILLVALVGKVGGGYAGARLTGIPPRGSALMGVLVSTRGLTELVILSVGLQEHLLNPQLYALLIVMALVTTAMTGPLLNWIQKPMALSASDPPDLETRISIPEPRVSLPVFGSGGFHANVASSRRDADADRDAGKS